MIWTRQQWHARRDAHLERTTALARAFMQRRSHGKKHPVEDFLFTYYRVPPTRLMQWSPPLGIRIEVSAEDLLAAPWLTEPPFHHADGFCSLDATQLQPRTRDLAAWIAQLGENILQRPPRLRCYGLHEWAMVYRQSEEQIRHQGYELRLPPEELARFVDSQAVCCSHYDAYRFFTPEARPLNAYEPTLEARLEMEQSGCLHANMDLYKWAAKLMPWIGSDLVGECFALAWEGRQLDMRASPYDLAALGYDPVRIETPEGRADYEQQQRHLAERSTVLRRRLTEQGLAIKLA